jgi:hypothetical protein
VIERGAQVVRQVTNQRCKLALGIGLLPNLQSEVLVSGVRVELGAEGVWLSVLPPAEFGVERGQVLVRPVQLCVAAVQRVWHGQSLRARSVRNDFPKN